MKGIILIAVLAVFGFSETTFAEKMSDAEKERLKDCLPSLQFVANQIAVGNMTEVRKGVITDRYQFNPSVFAKLTLQYKKAVMKTVLTYHLCMRPDQELPWIYFIDMYNGKKLARYSWDGELKLY